eukprot:UN21683
MKKSRKKMNKKGKVLVGRENSSEEEAVSTNNSDKRKERKTAV